MQAIKDMIETGFDAVEELVNAQGDVIKSLRNQVKTSNDKVDKLMEAMKKLASQESVDEVRDNVISTKEYLMPTTNLPSMDEKTFTYKLLDKYVFPVDDVKVLLQIEKELRNEMRVNKTVTDCPVYMIIVSSIFFLLLNRSCPLVPSIYQIVSFIHTVQAHDCSSPTQQGEGHADENPQHALQQGNHPGGRRVVRQSGRIAQPAEERTASADALLQPRSCHFQGIETDIRGSHGFQRQDVVEVRSFPFFLSFHKTNFNFVSFIHFKHP
jgi:hypothetical protein